MISFWRDTGRPGHRRIEGFPPGASIVRWHKACSPGMIERSLEIGEHPISSGPSPAHGLGIFAVESREIGCGPKAGTPVSWSFRNPSVPILQPPRGQFPDREVSELGQDIPTSYALNAVGGLAAAAAVILEIVGHGPRDGVCLSRGGAKSR